MYDILRDFAGPIVTMIAASIAGLITFTFARLQIRIAKSQRDIALDKLKFDLFQKCYEIYQAAKKLIEQVSHVSDLKKTDANQIRELYVTLDEARFYFSPEIQRHLRVLSGHCEHFFLTLAQRELLSIDDPKWSQTADELAADQAKLREFYAGLPEKFETALAFKQLTTPQ